MVPYRIFFISILTLSIINGCLSAHPDDCNEVGFARAAGAMVLNAYQTVKDEMLPRWGEEDSTGHPLYTLFKGHLKNVTRVAYLLEEVSKEVVARIRKTRIGKRCKAEWILRGIEKHVTPLVNLDSDLVDSMGIVMGYRCVVGTPYPNVDGTCIGEQSPDVGAIGAKFLRLHPCTPGSDGFSLRQSSSEDRELPSSRLVATTLRSLLKKPPVTNLFTAFAHFVQMDIYSIPESPMAEGVDCCASPDAEDCAPILVPESDPLHAQLPCINFRRSAKAQAILGHREQFSIVSAFVDATPLYGDTNEEAFKRKTGFFGYLKGAEKLETSDSKCNVLDSFDDCFEQDESFRIAPSLRALLQLEHNRVADELSLLNPHFDDALLYNEARRIMIAQYNVILYGQYLKTLLGEELLTKHSLKPGGEGPGYGYYKDVNSGVLTSFAVAAFRNPSMLTEWNSQSIGREELFGSSHYSVVKDDSYQDILALDVQRGRDQGLAGYLTWRRFCEPGLVLDSWEHLKQVMSEESVDKLKELYNGEIDDIDAMAALLEPPVEGGVSGATFSCIMVDQFARLKTGNRLYWEHQDAMMNPVQQAALSNITLAGVLCANLPVDTVPQNPLLPVSDTNPSIQCSELTPLDINEWTDTSLVETMKEVNENIELPTYQSEKALGAEKSDSGDDDASEGVKSSQENAEGAAEEEGQTRTPDRSNTKSVSSVSASGVEVKEGEPTASMAGAGAVSHEGALPLTTATTKDEL